jgi:hypothetical protein
VGGLLPFNLGQQQSAFGPPAEWRVLANNWMKAHVIFLVVAEEHFTTATG